MTPAIQTTLTTATRHWFGDAQGQGACTFRGVSRASAPCAGRRRCGWQRRI